jgi:hypothetical protein
MSRQHLGSILFCNQKNVDLFLELPKACLNRCAHTVDVSYSYAYTLLKIWKKQDLVVIRKVGRDYNIIYTMKGRRLAELLLLTKNHLRAHNVQWSDKELISRDFR